MLVTAKNQPKETKKGQARHYEIERRSTVSKQPKNNRLIDNEFVSCLLCHPAAPYWRNNIPPSDMEVDEEEDFETECQADGLPRPTITWSVNGDLIKGW